VLARFGITEAAMGCPIRSQLDVVSTGRTPEGIETWMDRAAYESAGVMPIARIKWHTDFEGSIESGLFKMMAFGLGKPAGARDYHEHAYRLGLERVILSVGRQTLAGGKVLGGLAVVEDGNHRISRVEAMHPRNMERRERELLALAKSMMGRLPIERADVLVVDEAGKNFSGTGIDTKVVNRDARAHYNAWREEPMVNRILIRGLSPQTHGNANGIGLADAVPDRLLEQIDWRATLVNILTSTSLALARTPIHFPSDRECLEALAGTVGRVHLGEVTYCWIRNTLELDRAVVSENLRSEVERNPLAEPTGPPFEMEFDAEGNLRDPFGVAW
jgi:hypothetical protein